MGRGQGFAALTPQQRKEVAALGGKTAHQKGTAHRWGSAEAREAGRKGGTERGKRMREAALSQEPAGAAE